MGLISTLADFEQLLIIAKRHDVDSLKIGDIEVVMGGSLAPTSDDKVELTRSEERPDIDSLAYSTYKDL